jgi:proteic killer suppression protein
MDIAFKNKTLKKVFNSEKILKKEFGSGKARLIMRRMAVLRSSPVLAEVPHTKPERRHELSGKRSGQFAVDLKQPYRLIFKPNHEILPRKKDGGINLTKITAIKILGVEDYH